MERTIAEVDINLHSDEALQALLELQKEMSLVEKETTDVTEAMEDMEKEGTEAISRLDAAFMKLRRTLNFIFELFSGIVSKIKYMALAGLGTILGAAMGSNREATEGARVGLSWNGSRALEAATNLTGFSPNLGGLQEQLAEGTFNPDLIAMGLDPSKLQNKDPVAAYNDVFNKFGSKLDEQISLAGGDKSKGLQMFKAIYGDMLQNLLGMGAGEFNNLRNSGVLGRFNQAYGDASKIYGGIDSKDLMEGERALWKFWETLKAVSLKLTAEAAPHITRFLDIVSSGINKIKESSTVSKVLDSIGKAFSNIWDIAVKLEPVLQPLVGMLGKLLEVMGKLLEKLTGALSEGISKSVDYVSEKMDVYDKEGAWGVTKSVASDVKNDIAQGIEDWKNYEHTDQRYEELRKKKDLGELSGKEALELNSYEAKKAFSLRNPADSELAQGLKSMWKNLFGDKPTIKSDVKGSVDVNIHVNGQRVQTAVAPIAGAGELARNPGVR